MYALLLHRACVCVLCMLRFDVLRGIYSWTDLPEDGVSGHRNASEQ